MAPHSLVNITWDTKMLDYDVYILRGLYACKIS